MKARCLLCILVMLLASCGSKGKQPPTPLTATAMPGPAAELMPAAPDHSAMQGRINLLRQMER